MKIVQIAILIITVVNLLITVSLQIVKNVIKEDGFTPSFYTIEEHSETSFPLEGAHLATPCAACHLLQEEWDFDISGEKCVDCHTDIHEGYLDVKYYPDDNCTGLSHGKLMGRGKF